MTPRLNTAEPLRLGMCSSPFAAMPIAMPACHAAVQIVGLRYAKTGSRSMSH